MKKLFISYSHKDEDYKNQLIIHMSGLKRNKLIDIWEDRQILIGDKWSEKISQSLTESEIILFLISPDFLASEYINEVEIKKAITRHNAGDALIIPIFIRPCDFTSSILADFQGVPRDLKFLSSWADKDQGYLEIVKEFKDLLHRFKPKENRFESTIKKTFLVHSDTPPDINKWVGRVDELSLLLSTEFKVVFITGFGGQGKSSLATKYLQAEIEKETFLAWDWRDFKEEENRLKTKTFEIIKRFADSDYSHLDLRETSEAELVELLFQVLADKKVLFIFDNIDSYIDYDSFTPFKGFEKLIDSALSLRHNCRFVFTCRPFIKKADVGFYQLQLSGLKLESSVELLEKYNIPIKKEKKENLFSELHDLTKGHPMWLHLLAAQATRGIDLLEKFIKDITSHTNFDETNISKILSDQIIDKLWVSLNTNQKKLLRCLSEHVRAEEVETTHKIIESELNWNQFSKALKSLKLLNLIVTKTRVDNKEELELHPLLKSFIKSKYPPSERNKFITIIINYYNKVTFLLKERISGSQELSFYENWSNKVELAVNKNDFSGALSYLKEIASPMLIAGYFEEYIRIGNIVYSRIDFEKHLTNGTPYFVDQLQELSKTFSEATLFDESKNLYEKLEKAIVGKGSDYITLCWLKCNYFWNKHEYDNAIYWGKEASKLSSEAQIDNNDHYLYLAKRDSGIEANIKESLVYFLGGNLLSDILSINVNSTDHPAHYFGNIGRCLYLLKEYEKGLICYAKSFTLCYLEQHTNKFQNRGYISYWIGQLLWKLEKKKEAHIFYSNSLFYWKRHNPNKSNLVLQDMEALETETPHLRELLNIEDEAREKMCKEFCENYNKNSKPS